jgi:hypothetical protein
MCPANSWTLLYSVSWPDQIDEKGIYEKIKGLKGMEIPTETTTKVQSLDIFSIISTKSLAVVFTIEWFPRKSSRAISDSHRRLLQV